MQVFEKISKMNKQKLDQIIENAKPRSDYFDVKESEILGEEALKEEFLYLAKRIFGEGIYVRSTYSTDMVGEESSFSKLQEITEWFGTELDLYKKVKGRIFSRKEQYLRIRPEEGFNLIIKQRTLNPVTLHAYTPEALEKAKLFAQSYRDLSGKEATVIQEFKSQQSSLEKLAAPQKKKRHNPEINSEDHLDEMFTGLKGSQIFSHTDSRIWRKHFEKTLKEHLGDGYRVKYSQSKKFLNTVESALLTGCLECYYLIFKRKKVFGLSVDVKVAEISMDRYGTNSPLKIKVKNPETLEVMAPFARKYQEIVVPMVEIIKQYKDEQK